MPTLLETRYHATLNNQPVKVLVLLRWLKEQTNTNALRLHVCILFLKSVLNLSCKYFKWQHLGHHYFIGKMDTIIHYTETPWISKIHQWCSVTRVRQLAQHIIQKYNWTQMKFLPTQCFTGQCFHLSPSGYIIWITNSIHICIYLYICCQ